MTKPATRAWTFMLLLSFLIILAGQTLGERQGLLWGVAIALSINTLIFFYGELRLAPWLAGREVEGTDPWSLLSTSANLSDQIRIPRPRIFILDSATPQALSVGNQWRAAKIYLTRGLLEKFNAAEREAVLAYEISTIKQQNTFAFTVVGAVADTFMVFAFWSDKFLRILIGTKKRPHSAQNHAMTYLISPLVALVIRLSVNKQDYLLIDKMAAELIHDPKRIANVLWKLHSYSSTIPLKALPGASHFYMVNPLTKSGWNRYFLVQPQIDTRIKSLIGHFPM